MHKIFYSLLISLFFLTACNQVPKKVETVLNSSGNNKIELQKVIQHYKKTGEDEKIRSAYFLIENMDGKYSTDGDPVRNFDVLFDILDSLHKHNVKIITSSPILKNKWDSLVNQYGKPMPFETEKLDDHKYVTADLLINNIDWAFKLWKTSPLISGLKFEQFCEYLLPYRAGTERLEFWREHLSGKYKTFMDTVKVKNRLDLTAKMNLEIRKLIALNHTMRLYPYDMTISQMEKARRGACRHLVLYTTMAMRAVGLPIGMDYAQRWGDLDRGHEWNTLLMENGKMHPFNAAGGNLNDMQNVPYRFSKVYRVGFAKQEIERPPKEEVPNIYNEYDFDVTPEYTKTYNFNIRLKYQFHKKRNYAIIATFGRRNWEIQDWGKIRDNVAWFEKMGANLLYIAMYYEKGKYYPASDPFILSKDGKITYVILEKGQRQEMNLLRKYPYMSINVTNAKEMLGAKLQGANKADFSDSINLFVITKLPARLETVVLKDVNKFRYFRYLTSKGKKANLAELGFYGTSGKRIEGRLIGEPEVGAELGTPYQNAFDGKLDTYFNGGTEESWAGLDAGKPQSLTMVKYAPRSDTNFILIGDTYELKYWDCNKWVSAGKKISSSQTLTFTDIPSNGVYILYNISQGTEHRIFTYKNGSQVWW